MKNKQGISKEQLQALMARQRNAASGPSPAATPIHCPLSSAQTRLYYTDADEAKKRAAYSGFLLRLEGALDQQALRQAWQDVLQRHAILRTAYRFNQEQNTLLQTVLAEVPVSFSVQEAGSLDSEQICENFYAGLAFDLAAGKVAHALLVRQSAEQALLCVAVHHIAFDGWSRQLMIDDLGLCYQARRAGHSPAPGHAQTYLAWANEEQSKPPRTDVGDYWQQTLDGLQESDVFTYLRKPAAGQASLRHTFSLGSTLSAQVRQLADSYRTTPYTVLLSAYKLLLLRFTLQEDICVGTPVANRLRAEYENIIGCFVNSLALRSRVTLDQSFAGILQAEHQVLLQALEYQDYPFNQVVQALYAGVRPPTSPLFQAMFSLQTPVACATAFGPDVRSTLQPMADDTALFDLTLNVEVDGNGFEAELMLAPALADAARAQQMASHFIHLLSCVLAAPEVALKELDLMPVAERERVLQLAQGGRSERLENTPQRDMISAFAHSVAMYPDHIALEEAGCGQLSYRQLAAHSERLAHALQAAGLRRGMRVVLVAAKSIRLVAALLAIMQNGASYLCLEPDTAPERIRYLIDDVQADFVLGAGENGDRYLNLAQLWDSAPVATTPFAGVCAAEDEAYVIYTSGTTGQAKGISISQGAITSLALERGAPLIVPGRRILFNGALSFDMYLLELWPALLHGACLVIDAAANASLTALAQVIQTRRIEMLGLTPAVFHRLIIDEPQALARLQCLHTGGEAVQFEAVSRFLSLPGAEQALYVNDYGPAENSVASTRCILRRQDLSALPGIIPIGRALAERTCYVLDAQRQPVPYGAPGILYVGGAGVGSGYLHNPQLTAQRFVSDPFAAHAQARMYDTGDLGYYGADGNVYIIGRADTQVKVNGVRIELEGVEAAILATGLVLECAAVVKRNALQDKILAAYCVFAAGADVAQQEALLRSQLTQHLPQYFIPSLFLALPAMPLSASGKIERGALAALPLPNALEMGTEVDADAAQTLTAEARELRDLYRDFFKTDALQMASRFFELGGHSLLALSLSGKIETQFGVRLPASLFLRNPSIAEVAEQIANLRQTALPLAVSLEHQPGSPLSVEQQRLWFLMRMSPQAGIAYNIPFAIQLQGNFSTEEICAAVRRCVAGHPLLCIRIQHHDDLAQVRQVVADPADFAFSVHDVQGMDAAQQEQRSQELQQALAQHAFALEQEAPIRAALEVYGNGRWRLLLVVHHVVFDGWSREIFVTRLAAQLQADPAAAVVDSAYFDYIQAQQRLLQAAYVGPRLDYWRQRLQAAPPPLALNASKVRPALQTYAGHTVHMLWSAERNQGLRDLARRLGTSEFVLLQALVKAFLARIARSQDVIIGVPLSTRLDGGNANTLGYFVNMLASRSRIDDSQDFLTLVQHEAQQLQADLQQSLPFDLVLNALNLPRDLSRSPLFQVCVTHNCLPPVAPTAQSGFGVHLQELDLAQAKFDLSFDFTNYDQAQSTLTFSLNYNCDVFLAEEANALLQAFSVFADDILQTPAAALHQAGLLAESQRAVLTRMNDTLRVLEDENLAQAFARSAARQAQQAALIGEEQTLSYHALQAWAGAIGEQLLQAGVKPGARVIVLCDRSMELVGAMLAVLACGAAYIPVDPDYPLARIEEIAAHCQAQVIVCRQEHVTRCPAGMQVIGLTPPQTAGDAKRFLQLPALSSTAVRGSDAAYIMFTSGSTGKPKGVVVNHAGVLRLVLGASELPLTPAARMVQATSAAFDVSAWEIYGALLNGSGLVMIPKAVLLSAPLLRETLLRHDVSHMFATPTLARNLQHECADVFSPLRELWVGGEAVSLELAAGLLHAYPTMKLVNGYGPTECTVFALTKHITAATVASGTVPIGLPYSNTTAWVLDEQQRLLPPCFEGEIYLAGPGVAQGYLGNPELTAEKFIADPLADGPLAQRARWYRSGDRGRVSPAGEIEYLGRIDKQIKIRGYRIEPGEVETALCACPGVQQAVVCARTNPQGEKCLCAYVIADPRAQNAGALQNELRQRLPAFLTPQYVIFVQSFPATANGKMALEQLPEPAWHSAQTRLATVVGAAGDDHSPAALAVGIRQIWCQLLGHNEFHDRSGFFEVGGNSLLAMQLRAALAQTFLSSITVLDCFQFPDVASMAQYLSERMQPATARANPISGQNPGNDSDLPGLSRRNRIVTTPRGNERRRVREEF